MKYFTVFALKEGLIADGAILASEEAAEIPPPRQGFRLIAAFISQAGHGDFHFYRQMSDGSWTHKPGVLPVARLDSAGQPIANPYLAARDYRDVLVDGLRWENNYAQFAGFFYIPEAGLQTKRAAPPKLLDFARVSAPR